MAYVGLNGDICELASFENVVGSHIDFGVCLNCGKVI